ncbi:MAG: UDP-N-acetylmuramoyl-tripeptide-D-alanyl-D-alanine ligase [Parcubacteria group bacterium Athens0416_74]|nr:MAG: UDP-N-acetylmuramoyl-tripeptide-D-alanyl-D-alanine ligase [Parcubacteria group bacterium Athens0416_74]
MLNALKKILVTLLVWEARLVLWRHKPRIIAVTGSVGKTTTKDAIYAGLSGTLHMRKSAKSFNSDIGVPLTILGCENAWSNPFLWIGNLFKGLALIVLPADYPQWLVLEVGADRPGDIRRIAKWLRPEIAVFTGVPEIPAHVEYFSSPEDVMKEKRALAEYVRPGGKLVINGDDLRSRQLHGDYRGISVTYGCESNNDFFSSHEEIVYKDDEPVGVRFRANHGASSIPVNVHGALGRPRVYAALAAIAVGDCVGVDSVSVSRALDTWEPPPGRVRILPGMKYSVLIDDTYNSSPVAALAALDLLADIRTSGRKIAILGDMLELGRYTKEAHRQVGERAAKMTDVLVTVGFRSRAIAEAALDAGMPEMSIRQYDMGEAERVAKELLPELRKGDIILVKGSQGMRLEKCVRALMAEPDRAAELLVRMEDEWSRR